MGAIKDIGIGVVIGLVIALAILYEPTFLNSHRLAIQCGAYDNQTACSQFQNSHEPPSKVYSVVSNTLVQDVPFNGTVCAGGKGTGYIYTCSTSQNLTLYPNLTQIEINSLKANNTKLNQKLNLSYATYNALERFMNSPILTIWTIPQTVSDSELYGNLPDTFANHIEFTASSPVNFTISSVGGPVHQLNGTSVNLWFNESEGCSGYFFSITSAIVGVNATIYPNITAQYAPTPYLTGVCAQRGGQV